MAFPSLLSYIGPVNYRLYRPDDFADLYAIEKVCFRPPLRFSRRYLRQIVVGPDSMTWIAEQAGKRAGFAVVEWQSAEGSTGGYIQTIEVLPEYRRRGVGLELLRRIEASASVRGASFIWLHVDAENENALRLYRSNGYECRGREANYYERSRAADIYVKLLSAPGNDVTA